MGWRGAGQGSDDAAPPIALAIDRGSTWTKASVVGHVDGRWHIAAHVSQPTEWGEEELLSALAERLRPRVLPEAAASLDGALRAAPRLETATLLPMPTLGIVPVPGAPPVEEIREMAQRTGWRVRIAGEQRAVSAAHRFAALRDVSAEAWLVVAPASRPAAASDTARLLVAAMGSVEGKRIVWAAPRPPGESVERILLGADLRYVPHSARRSRFLRRASAPASPGTEGLSESLATLLEDVAWASDCPSPTTLAFRRAVEAIARAAELRVLAVDIGAAASTSVQTDGRESVMNTDAAAGLGRDGLDLPGLAIELATTLPAELDDARVGDVVRTIAARPATLPDTADEVAVSAGAVRHALGVLLADARPLAGFDLLIGASRSLAAAAPAAAAELLVEGVRPVGITQLALDAAGVLPSLGALDAERLSDAIAALGPALLVPLGTAVICAGGAPGAQAMQVRVSRESGDVETLSLRYGQVEVLPLPSGESAEVEIELGKAISLGMTRTLRRVRARVTGGAVGLIFDARDVPIAVPRRGDDRRIVLAEWHGRFLREGQRREVEA